VAHWIAVSEAVRNHLIIELGVCGERINVVGNFTGEPVTAFSQTEARAMLATTDGLDAQRPWVLAVGNIDPVKAPETFVALAGRPNLQECQFIWIGGGLDTASGRSLRRTPSAKQVRFLGARSDVAMWMRAADALVVTSHEESSSLVTLEAMGAGLPVIAFAGTGGPDEILAEGRGLLVPERSATAMAVAVQHCLSRSADIGRMVKTAQSWVGHEANSNRQCEKLAAVLETVAAQKPHVR
jgi:glycosyltransferase involved in cell wall biosynthesis